MKGFIPNFNIVKNNQTVSMGANGMTITHPDKTIIMNHNGIQTINRK